MGQKQSTTITWVFPYVRKGIGGVTKHYYEQFQVKLSPRKHHWAMRTPADRSRADLHGGLHNRLSTQSI